MIDKEQEVIKRKAKQLKGIIGMKLSLKDCETFIECTISDYKNRDKDLLNP